MPRLLRVFAVVLCLSHSAGLALAATGQGFREPAAPITALLTAPAPAQPLVHARSGHLALVQYEQVISLQRLMAPRLGLAGMRIDPVTRFTGIDPLVLKVDIIDTTARGQKMKHSWQPQGAARLAFPQFSPDGSQLAALQVETGKPTVLRLFDIATGRARTLTDRVNPAWGNPCQWLDGQSLLCRMQPFKPLPQPVPGVWPLAIEHQGKRLPTRTYAHLLESPYDDARFEYYFATDLARVTLDGQITPVQVTGGLIIQLAAAPDGQHLMLRRVVAPYPRMVGVRQFPAVIEVWNLASGKRLYQSAAMGFGIDEEWENEGDPTTISWAPLLPATAGFLFREERADGSSEYQWRAVQAGKEPQVLARSERPIRDFGWTSAGTPWFITNAADGKRVDIQVILPGGTRTLWRGDRADRYENPGRGIRVDGSDGPVLEADGSIFVAGSGLTSDGVRPFVERLELASGKSRRVFTAESNVFETALAVLDAQQEIILTSQESETTPPVYRRVQSGQATELFRTPNPYPQLDKVKRQRITYPRADGVTLSANLYLPEGAGKKPLPTLIWIYPREFSDNRQAEQLDIKPFQFHRIKGPSPIAAALAGYAVLVNPTVPIISDSDTDNQEYLPQLVSSTNAAVDYLVKQGISDPKRMAIGGRSYGAFSTANLLIHSDRFATGIAMSGAYNRTLTPFGFQHEKRTFWDVTEYYTSISPFFFANKMKKPLLLVHGGADSNPGTPKVQARRFFHALVGEGATVRYAELPGEEHHYSGRETVLQAAWEMIDWLDRMMPAPAQK